MQLRSLSTLGLAHLAVVEGLESVLQLCDFILSKPHEVLSSHSQPISLRTAFHEFPQGPVEAAVDQHVQGRGDRLLVFIVLHYSRYRVVRCLALLRRRPVSALIAQLLHLLRGGSYVEVGILLSGRALRQLDAAAKLRRKLHGIEGYLAQVAVQIDAEYSQSQTEDRVALDRRRSFGNYVVSLAQQRPLFRLGETVAVRLATHHSHQPHDFAELDIAEPQESRSPDNLQSSIELFYQLAGQMVAGRAVGRSSHAVHAVV